MTTKTTATDTRSEAQKKVDEAAALGSWAGFDAEELLTEKGALEIIAQEQKLSSGAMSVCNQPFRWKNQVFRILRCDFFGEEPLVEVIPKNDEFAAEVKRRLAADRFHHLAYCQGFGFACFPEDYGNYQE